MIQLDTIKKVFVHGTATEYYAISKFVRNFDQVMKLFNLVTTVGHTHDGRKLLLEEAQSLADRLMLTRDELLFCLSLPATSLISLFELDGSEQSITYARWMRGKTDDFKQNRAAELEESPTDKQRIYYFHDPRNQDRVMTVVLRQENKQLYTYAYSINRPKEWRVSYSSDRVYTETFDRNGDQFSKKAGLSIARGRLAKVPFNFHLEMESSNPKRALLVHMLESESSIVRRIAEHELAKFDQNAQRRAYAERGFVRKGSLARREEALRGLRELQKPKCCTSATLDKAKG